MTDQIVRQPADPARDGAVLRIHHTAEPPSRTDSFLFAALVVAFVVARVWRVPSFRVWFDEIYSVLISERGWLDLLWVTLEHEPHPPLFFMTVKLWTMIGGWSFTWLGLYSAFWMIAALGPLLLLARELGLRRREINFALAILALNGYLIGYSEELRSYSLMFFLTAASLWLFVRFCNAPTPSWKTVAPLALITVVIAYTEYLGWLVVAAEGLFLLVWNRRRFSAFAAIAVVSAVAFLPWAYLAAESAARRMASGQPAFVFVPRPSLFSVAFFYGNLNGVLDLPHSTLLGLALFGIPIVITIASLMLSRHRSALAATSCLLLCALVPVLALFLASHALPNSIWGQRHLIGTAIPYALLVSVSILGLRQVALRRLSVAVALVWVAAAGADSQAAVYKSPGWDRLVAQLVSGPGEGVSASGRDSLPVKTIYALSEDEGLPVQFYLDRFKDRRYRVVVLRRDDETTRRQFGDGGLRPFWALTLPVLLIRELGDIPEQAFWIADDGENGSVLGHDKTAFRDMLTASGFHVGQGFTAEYVNRRWNRADVHLLPVTRGTSRTSLTVTAAR